MFTVNLAILATMNRTQTVERGVQPLSMPTTETLREQILHYATDIIRNIYQLSFLKALVACIPCLGKLVLDAKSIAEALVSNGENAAPMTGECKKHARLEQAGKSHFAIFENTDLERAKMIQSWVTWRYPSHEDTAK